MVGDSSEPASSIGGAVMGALPLLVVETGVGLAAVMLRGAKVEVCGDREEDPGG